MCNIAVILPAENQYPGKVERALPLPFFPCSLSKQIKHPHLSASWPSRKPFCGHGAESFGVTVTSPDILLI